MDYIFPLALILVFFFFIILPPINRSKNEKKFASSLKRGTRVITKSGMYGFTRSLARELAKDNIRVNAVSPGFVETDMLHTVPPDLLAGIKEEIPLGRFGYADEIALAVLYLCSPAASWVTGTNMSINGGHNML